METKIQNLYLTASKYKIQETMVFGKSLEFFMSNSKAGTSLSLHFLSSTYDFLLLMSKDFTSMIKELSYTVYLQLPFNPAVKPKAICNIRIILRATDYIVQ